MNKKFLWAALLVCFTLFAPLTKCAAAEEPPILSVSGSGMVQGAPDQAAITLGVVTRAETAAEAQQENAAKATAIREALTALGIEDSDVKTEEYNFRPEYGREGNERVVVGYTASNTIRVRVRNVAKVGDVVDAVLASGANTIHSLDFSIRDTDALRKRALESAVKDARSKADAIAHALGKSIVGVQHVSENTGMFQPRQANGMMMMKSMDAAAESTPIDAGTMSLTADVHIDFILSR
ncbi:MAG: SIMPL domain-containing protein [Schwartzia sp.]|nr:SIMPL domain-containing protein [Schwartzia sp. (in: firmicutes)]MBR5163497.1 SIMPL domain-containing protein [Schwartzia sp. (in: firmicutes)]